MRLVSGLVLGSISQHTLWCSLVWLWCSWVEELLFDIVYVRSGCGVSESVSCCVSLADKDASLLFLALVGMNPHALCILRIH